MLRRTDSSGQTRRVIPRGFSAARTESGLVKPGARSDGTLPNLCRRLSVNDYSATSPTSSAQAHGAPSRTSTHCWPYVKGPRKHRAARAGRGRGEKEKGERKGHSEDIRGAVEKAWRSHLFRGTCTSACLGRRFLQNMAPKSGRPARTRRGGGGRGIQDGVRQSSSTGPPEHR